MLKTFFKNWWVLALKGVLLIAFGIIAFLNPGITLAIMLSWFAAFLAIDGILSLITVIRNWKTEEDKWLFVLDGVLNLVLGILIFRAPGTYAVFAVFLLGFWSIFSGISKIALAIQLRKEIQGEGWLALGGVLGILFGIIIIARPEIGVSTFMYMLGFFAVLIGVVLVLLGFKVRSAKNLIGEEADIWKMKIKDIKEGRLKQ